MFSISDRFLNDWITIESLKTLPPDNLHHFWLQVDSFIDCFDDRFRKNPPIHQFFDDVCDPVRQLIRLGDFTRARYVTQKLFDAAESQSDRLIKMRSAFLLGYIQFHLGDFIDSERYHHTGMQLLDDSTPHLIWKTLHLSNYALVCSYIKDHDRAIRCSRDALRLLHKLQSTIGIAEFDRIAEELKVPTTFWSQKSTLHSNFGAVYQAIVNDSPPGRSRDKWLTRVIRHHIRSIQTAPGTQDLLRSQTNFALSLVSRGDYDRADKILQKLVAQCLEPENTRVLSWINAFRAEAAMKMGAPDQALYFCHLSMKQAIRAADPVCQDQAMQVALEPLKVISSEAFKGNIMSQSFQESGFPIIREILNFLEEKDWYTARDHSIGVGRISTLMYDVVSEMSSISIQYDRDTFEMAALLHDIGKLWIPWTILNRTTPLWKDEFDIIRSHPEKGRKFLDDLGFPVIGAILEKHHERPDGKGYPDGENIGGIEERILAVADAYEAMTTANRSYRTPMSIDAAVREIIDLGSVQFDADVVRVLPVALGL
ncbi:HD domain-containing protein [bacterium]|nr:HD domain-containing protein [candidate division CSSED10-310 bacterium]